MNILHYSLGLPPYRTGGLTKYSLDLMKEQAKDKNRVYLLFPGKISLLYKKSKIKFYKNQDNINVYEIVNPLPVPLLNGIVKPKKFMESCDKNIFKEFLLQHCIEFIHVHTFMGLHRELLEAAKELDIKITYTTHDYFGICTKVNFIDNKGEVCNKRNIEKCLVCNKSAYSLWIIKVMQSELYRFFKNKGLISKIKFILSKFREEHSNEKIINCEKHIKNIDVYRKDFYKLIDYYDTMFSYIDEFLFNSSIAKQVYNSYFNCSGEIIGITHADIKDNRIIKNYDNKKLKITYLGPNKKYKGFNLLLEIMDIINSKYEENVELNIYGNISKNINESNIRYHGSYKYCDLKKIFSNTDLLIVPSIWYETFGFITLEAQSYGVPVLLTDNVGSKDILFNNNQSKGIITSVEKSKIIWELENLINNREILINLNRAIYNDEFRYCIYNHSKLVEKKYKNNIY